MKQTNGQVVLITLLVLTIATTVALSLIGRTTTDTAITTTIEDSSRAFNAAEAGIEEALRSGVGSGGARVLTGADQDVSYDVSVAAIGGEAGLYEFPKKTFEGVTETLWLAAHDDATGSIIETPYYQSPSISICWSSEPVTPAIVGTILYKEESDNSYRVLKVAYDPDPARATTNNFSSAYTEGGCGEGTGTQYKETIVFSSLNATVNPARDTLIALRLRPVYSDAKIVIDSGGAVLPQQGRRIESVGTTAAGTNRKIVVFQLYRSPSTLFDAALYSQGSLRH